MRVGRCTWSLKLLPYRVASGGSVASCQFGTLSPASPSCNLMLSRWSSPKMSSCGGPADAPFGAGLEEGSAALVVGVVGDHRRDQGAGVEDQRNGRGSNSSRLARALRSLRPALNAPINENGGCGASSARARSSTPLTNCDTSTPRLSAACRARSKSSPLQQKTPRRGGEAFLGLLQGGEICISIYVDPWEVGEPLMCRGRSRWESTAHMSGARPDQEVFVSPLSSLSCESLNQDTNIRAICV